MPTPALTAADLRAAIAEAAWAMVSTLRDAVDRAMAPEKARELHESLTEVAADALGDDLAYLTQCEEEAGDCARYAEADYRNDVAREDRAFGPCWPSSAMGGR